MWEVQGHGTVTGAGDPRDGAARREILPPWVDVRLTFADGARLDVLAVVRDGRIAIEGAQADPPLALDGFAALAEAIETPLQNACRMVIGQLRPPAPEALLGEPAAGEPAGRAIEPVGTGSADIEQSAAGVPGGEAAGGVAESAPTVDEPTVHESTAQEPAAAESAGAEPGAEPGIEQGAVTPAVEPAAGEPAGCDPADSSAGCGEDQEPSGRHRARPAAPRGSAARRSVAEIYRAAQREGRDPVLAVMSATGFSRRKSLRLIAGARDAGHLTPRHHRR
ncbi:DUF6214 family protein [Streptomyces sp. AK02-01A]|uniref:DUF6214 family protein n=1 Tax=Streptomyces sp. AK02-01A TaxID=3028648 RepID=UPI0029B02DD8|nr:DUF6214 family protein [Streptomyces sp. AK02-01A]MDX3854733.1 DUF6214 family protein [Streptomyces sp. AK02-01A]